MKALLIAAGLVVAGTAVASADPWDRGRHPYARHHHGVCQDKAHRLHAFERRASSDGRLSHRERDIMRALERDLDSTCGRYRWRG